MTESIVYENKSRCRNSLDVLEIPMSFSVTHTFFSFFFNSMYKTGKCCIYSCNWSFILTFVKLWEAEITGLARSQTFPGEQGLCSKDSVLSEMKKKKHTHTSFRPIFTSAG